MIINEIFTSIDGEVNQWGQGTFSTFIRLAGCNLNCPYCDTQYAQNSKAGKEMTVEEVAKKVEEIGCKKITITGGEPLLQTTEVLDLIYLLPISFKVSIETNGSILIPAIQTVCFVMDYKLDNEEKMNLQNFEFLTSNDWIKIVISGEEDYQRTKEIRSLVKSKYGCQARIAFSPVHDKIDPADLIRKLKQDKLFDVVVNLQIHKFIWPDGKES